MATWIEFWLVVSMIFIFHPTKGMIQIDSILGDCLVPATRFQPWYTSSWPSSHWGYQWTHWNGLAKEIWPFWTSIRLNCFMAPQETLEKEVKCRFYRGSTGKSPFLGVGTFGWSNAGCLPRLMKEMEGSLWAYRVTKPFASRRSSRCEVGICSSAGLSSGCVDRCKLMVRSSIAATSHGSHGFVDQGMTDCGWWVWFRSSFFGRI